MRVWRRRAASAALGVTLALFGTAQIAGAQSDNDYSNDHAQSDNYSGDDSADTPADVFDTTMADPQPTAADVTSGLPAQFLEFVLAQSPATVSGPVTGVPVRLPVVNKRLEVHADGSLTMTTHAETQLLSAQAVAALAEPALDYSESMQALDIKDAYTLKPDGTRLQVSPDAIITRQKSVPAPYFTDLKEKVILFPNVEPGDTLVYDATLQSKPDIPGQFYFATVLPRLIQVDSSTLTFVTPKNQPLKFDTYGISFQKTESADAITYTAHFANPTSILEAQQFLPDIEYGVRIFATTVNSWDAFASAYTTLIAPKLAVTAKIQAKADEITAGITDRREQARKLYGWVSSHIRYVAIYFGDGGVVPHDADSVLANGFGDCKDHSVLYSALLKAKGISSDLVVINGSNGYSVPRIPQMIPFNHVIDFLPEFGLYADTTSNVTSFGTLPPFEYGKPVLHVGGSGGGSALRRTPILTESDSTYSSTTTLKINSDGKISATHSATASGAVASQLRALVNRVAATGVTPFAQAILQARKLAVASGNYLFSQTAELTPQYSYSSNYESANAIPADANFALPEGLNIVDAYSGAILGPVTDGRFGMADSVPCFSGHLTDDYTLALPGDRKLTSLPQDAQVQTANINYTSHWSQSGNTISVHHELQAHFDGTLCTGATLLETRRAILRIMADYRTRISTTAARPS